MFPFSSDRWWCIYSTFSVPQRRCFLPTTILLTHVYAGEWSITPFMFCHNQSTCFFFFLKQQLYAHVYTNFTHLASARHKFETMWSDLRLEKYRAINGFMCQSCGRDALVQPVVNCWPVQGVFKLQHPPRPLTGNRWHLNDGLPCPEITWMFPIFDYGNRCWFSDWLLFEPLRLSGCWWKTSLVGLRWTSGWTFLDCCIWNIPPQKLSFSLRPPTVAANQPSSFDARLHSGSPSSPNSCNPPSFLLCFPTFSSHLSRLSHNSSSASSVRVWGGLT